MSSSLAGVKSLIASNSIDIVFLQEVRMSSEQLNNFFTGLGFNAEANIDVDSFSTPGTAVIWKKSLPVENVYTIVSCRLQGVKLGGYFLLNIYAPSGTSKKQERSLFFSQEVFKSFSLFPNSIHMVIGDFNSVLNKKDIENGVGFSQKYCPALKDLIASFDLIDSFRVQFPAREEFTFFRPGKAASRLDRFYFLRNLIELSNTIYLASLSDHCAVVLQTKLNISKNTSFKSGRHTYWKLNTSILNDEDFLTSFSSFWKHLLNSQQLFLDKSEWWDKSVRENIKQFCIDYSKLEKRKRREVLISISMKSVIFFLISNIKA